MTRAKSQKKNGLAPQASKPLIRFVARLAGFEPTTPWFVAKEQSPLTGRSGPALLPPHAR